MEIDWLNESWTQETQQIMNSGIGKDFKKFYAGIKKEARARAKKSTCLWCGKPCSSFCNSHTVPQFVLKNISRNGKVFLVNSWINNAFLEYDSGVKKAGNFFLICNDCDNTIFQDYESSQTLETLERQNAKSYCAMALKNLCKALYKRRFEVEEYRLIYDELGKLNFDNHYLAQKIEVSKIDIGEYGTEINKIRKAITKGSVSPFNVIDSMFLDYTVPVAFQGVITLAVDLDGNLINDLYCDDPKYKQELLHLCIFPLENSSFITLFTHKGNRRYSKFKNQLKKCSLEDKLSIVNCLLFLYSEDMFCSGYLDIKSVDTSEFQKVIRTNSNDHFGISKNALNNFARQNVKEDFSLENHRQVPNLLSKDFSVEKLKSISPDIVN